MVWSDHLLCFFRFLHHHQVFVAVCHCCAVCVYMLCTVCVRVRARLIEKVFICFCTETKVYSFNFFCWWRSSFHVEELITVVLLTHLEQLQWVCCHWWFHLLSGYSQFECWRTIMLCNFIISLLMEYCIIMFVTCSYTSLSHSGFSHGKLG